MKRRVILSLAVLCAGIAWADLAQAQVARVRIVVNGKEVQVQDLMKIGEKTLRAASGAKVSPRAEWV